MQWEFVQILGWFLGILAALTTIAMALNKLWCRLTIEFDKLECLHSITSSLRFYQVPPSPPMDSTSFQCKFKVYNKTNKATMITKIRHEVRLKGKFRGTEEIDLERKLDGGQITTFDKHFLFRDHLLENEELRCQVILTHTYGKLKKKYPSSLVV